MKNNHKEWLKLTSNSNPVRARIARPILIRKLPRVQYLEDQILLDQWKLEDPPPYAHELLDDVTKEVFGVAVSETEFVRPDDYHLLLDSYPEKWAIDEEWQEHDDKYETAELSDVDRVDYFLEKGLDFRAENGNPLRSLLFIHRVAEAACKGWMGEIPKQEEVSLQSLKRNLQAEVENFQKAKRRAR